MLICVLFETFCLTVVCGVGQVCNHILFYIILKTHTVGQANLKLSIFLVPSAEWEIMGMSYDTLLLIQHGQSISLFQYH